MLSPWSGSDSTPRKMDVARPERIARLQTVFPVSRFGCGTRRRWNRSWLRTPRRDRQRLPESRRYRRNSREYWPRVLTRIAKSVDRLNLDARELDQPPGTLVSSHQAFVTRLGLGIPIQVFYLPQQTFNLSPQSIHPPLQAVAPPDRSLVSRTGVPIPFENRLMLSPEIRRCPKVDRAVVPPFQSEVARCNSFRARHKM